MIIVAHRGNMSGPSGRENNPRDIQLDLQEYPDSKLFFEVDIWITEMGTFRSGHDRPLYDVGDNFLLNNRIICHAKDLKTFTALLQMGAHCFMHDKDEAALTSKGWVWKYPEILNSNGELMGICTDYAKEFLFSLR